MPLPPPRPDRPPAWPPGPWDIFCRVIDNHGDLGVCWRLARAVAGGGTAVRLWVDDPAALAWMAPGGHPGVQLLHWTEALDSQADVQPGPVVIEAFGCDPPAGFVARMAAMRPPPFWINLEYLSAEGYVERSHGLPSPQWSGPGKGLTKWFFYPGFTAATGGLLHGDRAAPGTAEAPPRAAWARALGLHLPPAVLAGEAALVLVFAYPGLPWAAWLPALASAGPAHLLLPPGGACDALAAQPGLPAGIGWQALPFVPQDRFDLLLAGCDLAVVRGEDSFARANVAAAVPFLWHIYPQADGAHAAKLEAFLALYLRGAPPPLAGPLAGWFRALNGLGPPPPAWPPQPAWRAHQAAWQAARQAEPDLLSRLHAFIAARRTTGTAGTTG